MSSPYLGEIRIVSFNFPPKGWALCNGQLLAINQNQALFSLLGTTYGGDGRINFALPNLQGRTPLHRGSSFVQGQVGGSEAHTLTLDEVAGHSHAPRAIAGAATAASPAGGRWANGGVAAYSSGVADVAMNAASVGATGGGQPHQNMSPYLVLNFVIALQGIFPSQN